MNYIVTIGQLGNPSNPKKRDMVAEDSRGNMFILTPDGWKLYAIGSPK